MNVYNQIFFLISTGLRIPDVINTGLQAVSCTMIMHDWALS